MKIERIDLDKIHQGSQDDEPYVFTYRPDTTELHASIERSGLLMPPVLKEDDAGRLRVVCGSLRIQVLRDLSRESVEAFVASAREWTDAECVSRSILENRWHRGFNEVEKAIVFTRLHDRFPHLLPLLTDVLVGDIRMPQGPEALASYRFVLSLSSPILDGLATGALSLGQALLLKGFPAEEREFFFRVMAECGLTFQESRKAAEWILGMAGRGRGGSSELLQEGAIQRILDETGAPRQKAKRLLSLLRNHRYPLLESWKARVAAARSKLGIKEEGIKVSHDPTFETTEIRVQIQARSESEFRERFETLTGIVEGGEIGRLFQTLSLEPENK